MWIWQSVSPWLRASILIYHVLLLSSGLQRYRTPCKHGVSFSRRSIHHLPLGCWPLAKLVPPLFLLRSLQWWPVVKWRQASYLRCNDWTLSRKDDDLARELTQEITSRTNSNNWSLPQKTVSTDMQLAGRNFGKDHWLLWLQYSHKLLPKKCYLLLSKLTHRSCSCKLYLESEFHDWQLRLK